MIRSEISFSIALGVILNTKPLPTDENFLQSLIKKLSKYYVIYLHLRGPGIQLVYTETMSSASVSQPQFPSR